MQQVTSSLFEVETDSQSDVVDQVVGSSSSSLSVSSPENVFVPQPCAETLRRQNMSERMHGLIEMIVLVARR